MNMKKMGKLVLSALSVLGLAACAVGSADQAEEVLGESQDALVTCNGTVVGGFFGSDTLKDAITAAIATWGGGNLTYLGTGSGNGEKCLEGSGPVTCGGVTYCNGTKDQAIAPMSRDFDGTCQTGEKSNRIGLDAIAIWSDKAADQSATGATSTAVADAFCGTGLDVNGKRNGTGCTVDTWTEFTSGSTNPSADLVRYRRDDASGTTEVFKEKNNCSAFCPAPALPSVRTGGVNIVVEDLVAGPRLSTDAAGTSSLVANPPTANAPCLQTDSATVCIGKLAGASANVIGYAGLGAKIASGTYENKALVIDGVAPTEANIRALITSPSTAYKYARFLYLNEGNGTLDAFEEDFRDWALGRAPGGNSTTARQFEDKLFQNGFIRCKDPLAPGYAPLACGPGKC
ncbi:substrate-binding domain-containing protein [Sorangium sp. So ce296]|uniref:hypothetical protein n=1 Tax=Sorangium sp. So ce296 TaxID=3133296 RepID=UPI003F60BB28